VKKATYAPALVAITQTSIIGKQRRRLTVREAARLQGIPEWFSFDGQSDATSFKQLGNGVNMPVVYHVMRALVNRDKDLLKDYPKLVRGVLSAGDDPKMPLEKLNKRSN
jgi:DNA (cytosine-5)-methyltransferase 1